MSKWSSAFRDSRWQKLRLEIMERDGWTCKSCGATGDGVTLNVHHAYYESGKAPWEYPTDTLVTWCEDCHGKIHEAQKAIAYAVVSNEVEYTGCGAIDIINFIRGVMDSRFGCGPSWSTNKSYCQGFAVGKLHVDFPTACHITRQAAAHPADWGPQ
jgi:hypothetical protein